MANLTKNFIKQTVRDLLTRDSDYRVAIMTALNAQFMDFAIGFFKDIVAAKIDNQTISPDWYKVAFLGDGIRTDNIATNAGINMKTIGNLRGSQGREIVISAANDNYEEMKKMIEQLVSDDEAVDIIITISIAVQKVKVELSINESLVVINALAVKRAALSGGIWSSIGKRTEGKLMRTLCHLFSVPSKNYRGGDITPDKDAPYARETDFYLLKGEEEYKCEVKLIGRGNPESADSAIAHKSHVFVADTMSKTNIKQMDDDGVEWVNLRGNGGYRRFGTVLKNLGIPHKPYRGKLEDDIDGAIKKAFEEKKKPG